MIITSLRYDPRADRMVISTDSDEQFGIGFSDYAARKSLYVRGGEMSEELLEVTLYLQEKYGAMQKALRTLKSSPKTSAALLRILKDAGFDPDVAKETVLTLKKSGVIREKEFCRRCAELEYKKGRGPLRIRAELRKKGFTCRMIDYTLDEAGFDFEKSLRDQLGRYPSGDREKLCRHFYSLGFPAEMLSDIT